MNSDRIEPPTAFCNQRTAMLSQDACEGNLERAVDGTTVQKQMRRDEDGGLIPIHARTVSENNIFPVRPLLHRDSRDLEMALRNALPMKDLSVRSKYQFSALHTYLGWKYS